MKNQLGFIDSISLHWYWDNHLGANNFPKRTISWHRDSQLPDDPIEYNTQRPIISLVFPKYVPIISRIIPLVVYWWFSYYFPNMPLLFPW
jgi:hypothetical protein